MAGSPWGNSRYPPFASPYAPAPASAPAPGPSYDPRRPQYGQPPPAGFYNPAVFSQQRSRAEYFPPSSAMPQPHIPHVLTPGSGQRAPSYPNLRANTGDLPDLFFTSGPSFPTPQVPQMPMHPPPPQIRQTVSAPAPPVPRKPDFSQPPLPPKPTRISPPGTLPLAQAGPGPSTFRDRRPSTAPVQVPRPSIYSDVPKPVSSPGPMEGDDQAMRAALEQSARDAEAARRREEEEIARAMAESLLISSKPVDAYGSSPASNSRVPFYASLAGTPSSMQPSASHSPYSSPSPPVPSKSTVQFPDQLHSVIAENTNRYTSSPPIMSQQILDDEALARRLAEEDAELITRQNQDTERAQTVANAQQVEQARRAAEQVRPVHSPPQLPVPPPEYSPSVPSGSTPSTVPPTPDMSSLGPPPIMPSLSRQPSPAQSGPPSPEIDLPRRSSANAIHHPPPPLHDSELRTGRSQSFGAYGGAPSPSTRPPLSHSHSSNALKSAGPSPQLASVPERTSSASLQPNGEASDPANGPSGSPVPSEGPRSSSQFVDNELLRGITIGFSPPAITAELTPMQGPIPNVIALPYGRAPPLHIKAPNWRDMLKLMARLSNTRLEPTVEAMAVVKTTMHLRVIVNFVKVHQSSNDWHVILYMTIDHPIPDDHRYKLRSTNDPALLPYSYTLAPTPMFLRESADGPMSKWYSIPSTPQNPYPALPMAFPDLATYLMTALEDSRGAANDRSSGYHRLAKAVDAFYPNLKNGDDEPEERRGLTDRVRGLFGRGNKANRPANDDRSNLVTPFYADDFGR